MARIRTAVKGLPEAIAAFQKAPGVFQVHFLAAASDTAAAVATRAKAAVKVRTGALRRHISWDRNEETGIAKAGIKKGTEASALTPSGVVRPSAYGHLVEFGHVGAPAKPFMIPAAEAERLEFLSRVRRAGQLAERELARSAPALPATTGGGFL